VSSPDSAGQSSTTGNQPLRVPAGGERIRPGLADWLRGPPGP